VPSAVINAKYSGMKRAQLTGVYFNNLNGTAFTESNWGKQPIGDRYLYDTETDEDIQSLGRTLLTTLGFSETQLSNYNNNFNQVNDLYIYESDKFNSGTAIRVGAKINTSINATNPFASNCLNFAPIVQFFVEVDTDYFFAIDVPLKGADPYYFIGSDFPTKKFYGNLTGDKLPVIGICARNFHSFNFVFDLGGSSITYTIEEDITIQSIRTKVYTSRLTSPKSLSPYSAVIYLITRNNYSGVASIQPPLAQVAAQIIEQNAQPNGNMIGQFYNPPTASIRTAEPPQGLIPPNYFTGEGVPPPPDSPSTSDDEFY